MFLFILGSTVLHVLPSHVLLYIPEFYRHAVISSPTRETWKFTQYLSENCQFFPYTNTSSNFFPNGRWVPPSVRTLLYLFNKQKERGETLKFTTLSASPLFATKIFHSPSFRQGHNNKMEWFVAHGHHTSVISVKRLEHENPYISVWHRLPPNQKPLWKASACQRKRFRLQRASVKTTQNVSFG